MNPESFDLFNLPPATPGSDTSKAAADAIRPVAATIRERVERFFIERGPHGATDEECQLALGLRADTERPRRRELVTAGLVRDSGKERPTTTGRAATVWTVATCSREGDQ